MKVDESGEYRLDDDLTHFIRESVFADCLGFYDVPSEFRVRMLGSTGAVFRCDDLHTLVPVVLKFFARKWLDNGHPTGSRGDLLQREYGNLQAARALGLVGV